MNRWVMNLSTDQYNKLIKKKNFVNEWMSYNIATVSLPDRRIFIRMTIDVYGPVPTLTAIQEYLGYKVNLNPETLAIGNQLQMDIDGQFFISHEWLPNVADYCYHALKQQEAFRYDFKRIFNMIPQKDWRLLIHKLRPDAKDFQADYDITKHKFDLITIGLLDIIQSYNSGPTKKSQLIDDVVAIVKHQDALYYF